MSMTSDQDVIRTVTRQGQIILGALITGVSIFLVIATVVDLGLEPGVGPPAGVGAGAGAQPSPSVPILTYMALVVGAACLPMSLIVPSLVAKQQRLAIAGGKSLPGQSPASTPAQRPEAVRTAPIGLPLAYLNQLIVGAAMNEGVAFFAGVAYLIEKNPIALAVALVLIAGQTLHPVREHAPRVGRHQHVRRGLRILLVDSGLRQRVEAEHPQVVRRHRSCRRAVGWHASRLPLWSPHIFITIRPR